MIFAIGLEVMPARHHAAVLPKRKFPLIKRMKSFQLEHETLTVTCVTESTIMFRTKMTRIKNMFEQFFIKILSGGGGRTQLSFWKKVCSLGSQIDGLVNRPLQNFGPLRTEFSKIYPCEPKFCPICGFRTELFGNFEA